MLTPNCLNNIPKNREILCRGSDFAYLAPCRPLIALISNFTITFPNASIISDKYTIMPHGSVTLVMLKDASGLHSLLFGPSTKPYKVGDIANKCDVIFIIEFQPAGFFHFVEIDQKLLTDIITPFSNINGSLESTLSEIFKTALTVDELLLETEKALIRSIRFGSPPELTLAIRSIIQAQGNLPAASIPAKVHYSSRHLGRLFNLYLGMSMKAFCRLVRINNSIRLLNDSENTLAVICEKLGYYDISHYVRDFKIVCNITPQEYRSNMSDFYSEVAKY